jgi:hypothetical protein
MKEDVKLCIKCARFVHMGDQCGRSIGLPDYVRGTAPKTVSAQMERTYDTKDNCGPTAKFFIAIVPAIDYAETMVKRDQLARHEGTPEHDTDVVGRALKAGM